MLESQRNGLILNYTINCSNVVTFEPVNDAIEGDNSSPYSHTVDGLTPGTLYVCTVAANNNEGAGPVAMVTNTTLEEGKNYISLYHKIIFQFY